MDSIIQAQGIHHITLNGSNRETAINFWQKILVETAANAGVGIFWKLSSRAIDR